MNCVSPEMMPGVMFKNTILFQSLLLSCSKDVIINTKIFFFHCFSHYNIQGIDFSIFQVPLRVLAKLFVCQQACGDASSISSFDCSKSFYFYRSPLEKRTKIYLQPLLVLSTFTYISYSLVWVLLRYVNFIGKNHTWGTLCQ